MEINRFIRKETAFKTKTDRFISHVGILADFKALSKDVSFAYMEISGGYNV